MNDKPEVVEHERAERTIRRSVFGLAVASILLASMGWAALLMLGGEGVAHLLWLGGFLTAGILLFLIVWARAVNRRISAVLQSMRYRLRDSRQGLLNLHSVLERRVREETERRLGIAESVIVDELTSLSNRRHFDWLLEQELRRARRSGQSLVLVLADVDQMHAINVNHGHAAGDRILVRVAEILQAAAQRAGDSVARIGGDQFALVMPDTTLQGALEVVYTIREHLAGIESLDPENEVGGAVTLSFGLASVGSPHSGASLHGLVESAESALARARGRGGDGVEAEG